MDGVEALPARTVAQATARSPAQSDDALVALVAAGDRNAMQALFLRHRVRVYRFIARMTKDAPAAADLTSEVFLEVWRQSARFEGRSTVSTWMLAIGRYKALSARQRHRDVQLDEMEVEATGLGRRSRSGRPTEGPKRNPTPMPCRAVGQA